MSALIILGVGLIFVLALALVILGFALNLFKKK